MQAADSLSFLETLDWITVDWVRDGRYTIAQAREKLDFTVERIRPSVAVAAALPLYESAVRALDAAEGCTMDLKAAPRAGEQPSFPVRSADPSDRLTPGLNPKGQRIPKISC